MIPTLGYISLLFSLAVSAALIMTRRTQLAGVLFGLLNFAFAALIFVHVTDDFSVMNVVQHSHTQKPLLYKISGVWGNHEGSMLLWVWILALWGFCLSRAKKMPELLRSNALSVQAMISFGFILFIALTSDPFARAVPAPAEGMDLNPVLQDPGLAIHPPLLYMGYVGFSTAFCLAMAALIEKKVDAAWAAHLRPWVLAAWIALTFGIASGAVWAYYELGWGGFWFWDPVENASLMPWLAGTALLHSVIVLEKRGALGNWVVFLSILAFSFSLLGTFLVRSGILTSVHAFATDPTRGIFILLLLAIAIGGALLFFALRAPDIKPGAAFNRISRETALLLNNVFLFTFCITVLMGTLYPIFMNALDLGSISVGPPYYNAVLLPLLIPFALLMGAVPGVAWGKGKIEKLYVPLLITAALLCSPLLFKKPLLSLVGFGLGGWVVIATLYDFMRKKGSKLTRSYYGMVIAHAGFGILIMGITATTLWQTEKITWVKPGDRVTVAEREIAFLGTNSSKGPNYETMTGIFMLGKSYLTPQKRYYPVNDKETSEVALKIDNVFNVIYLVLGDQDQKHPERWVVRAHYHPLALWILIGAIMIASGGAVSLSDRRRRE